VLNGLLLEPKRTEKGNRYYTLADIERMAHALVQNNAIDGDQLNVVIQLVLLEARLYHVIGEPGQAE
jgi:DNA-binding transcriptional MerR regulator